MCVREIYVRVCVREICMGVRETSMCVCDLYVCEREKAMWEVSTVCERKRERAVCL